MYARLFPPRKNAGEDEGRAALFVSPASFPLTLFSFVIFASSLENQSSTLPTQ